MKILLSTIYKGTAVIQAIKSFSPNKVYFIIDEPLDETRQTSINMVKDLFPEIEYDQVSGKIYDIVNIAKSVIDTIEKEKGNMSAVAKSLGISRPTLYSKMAKYNIK